MSSRYFPYALTLRSPLLMAGLGGNPNSATTLPYIPGSAIRGVVARALAVPGQDTTQGAVFHDLVLSGSARYLNAYPEVDGLRSLPTPVSLRPEKHAPISHRGDLMLHDLAAYGGEFNADPDSSPTWPEVALGGAGPRFLVGSGDTTYVGEAAMASRMHQQRDRARGRAWTDKQDGREEPHGTVFEYDAIEPGQTLRGIVLVEGGEQEIVRRVARLREVLGHRLLLGRSRRAGYGGDADLRWDGPVYERLREVLRPEADLLQHDLESGDQFRAVLLAPYLGRDPVTGQPDPAWLEQEVLQGLGGRARLVRRRWQIGVIGGYNRTWGLPLPQAPVALAGSVLVLEAQAATPLANLHAMEHRGIGERLIEGFGRLCFLEAPSTEMRVEIPLANEVDAQAAGEIPPLVREMQTRLLADRLDRRITALGSQLAVRAERLPTPSLIGRLRLPLRGKAQAALLELRAWLDEADPKLPHPALRQLDHCRLFLEGSHSPVTLRHWLLDVAGLAPLNKYLPVTAITARAPLGPAETAEAYVQSQDQYLRRQLLDATLAALARQRRLEERRHHGISAP